MLLPCWGVKEVDVVALAGVVVDEASAVFREKDEARSHGEINLSGEDSGAEQDIVAVSERPEDVHTSLRHSGINNTRKELGSLVDSVSHDETTETVGDDGCTAISQWHAWLIAW